MRKDNMGRTVNVEEADEYYPWMTKVLVLTQSRKINNKLKIVKLYGTAAIISYNRVRYLK
jgi:hypothetical protein